MIWLAGGVAYLVAFGLVLCLCRAAARGDYLVEAAARRWRRRELDSLEEGRLMS